MNKVTEFLERHVQWLTLGLALAYMGYIGYAYLYMPPLSVTVGKPPVVATPGDIDLKIVERPVKDLDDAIGSKKVDPPKVADVLKIFDERIGEKNVDTREFAMLPGGTHIGPAERSNQGEQAAGKVEHTPKDVPPAMPALNAPASAQWTVAMLPPAGTRTDVAYFMGAFTIDMAALSQAISEAFSKEKVPAALLTAEFVRVDLYRQEKLPTGWGPPVLIPPLPINEMQTYPGDQGKVPTNPKDQQSWFDYENWAQKSQPLFIQPPFYKTAADVAKPTVTVAPQAAGAAPAPPVAPPAPGVPALINPAGGANPGGGLNPALAQGNLTLTVNDATLQEGKTYRYAVRYRLFNPFYTKAALAVKEVADKFDYASPDPTDPKTPNVAQLWTAEITPEPRGYIFVQKINQFKGEAKFSILTWKDGHWHETIADKLSAGDPVSSVKAPSRWTLVDVRRYGAPSNESYVIVMDDKGVLEVRDEKGDAANPMQARLKAMIGASPAK